MLRHLDDLIELAQRAARAAGEDLRVHFRAPREARAKSRHDLVSAADLLAERRILDILAKSRPADGWTAEETGERTGTSGVHWYVDPLDGTNAFLMGVPYFAVSVAAAEGGRIVAGVVYNPLLDEVFAACEGGGATLNGQSIRVSECRFIEDARVACAFDTEPGELEQGLHDFGVLTRAARKTLVHFSPALDLCNVARGRMDAYVDNGTTPEDHAAAGLIVREAGGMVTTYGATDWDATRQGIVACSPPLYASLLALLERSMRGSS